MSGSDISGSEEDDEEGELGEDGEKRKKRRGKFHSCSNQSELARAACSLMVQCPLFICCF